MAKKASILKRSFNEEYDGLLRFFQDSWSENYNLSVFFAQKCLNLNELFVAEECDSASPERAERLQKLRRETFITQSALLLRSGELVEKYLTSGAFPRIQIVDELAVYGRDYAEFMTQLIDSVVQIWQKKTAAAMTAEQYNSIKDALLESIDYHVYMRAKHDYDKYVPKSGLLVENDLGNRILQNGNTKEPVSGNVWCRFSSTVTQAITRSPNVENTSFLPTFIIPYNDYQAICRKLCRNSWNGSRWKYRTTRTEIWQYACLKQEDLKLQCALQCILDEGKNSRAKGQVRIVPYVLFEDLTSHGLEQVRKILTDNFNATTVLFANWDTIQFKNLKLKFIGTVLSFLLFFRFIDEGFDQDADGKASLLDGLLSETNAPMRARIEKTAQSFGRINEVYAALISLCREMPGRAAEIWDREILPVFFQEAATIARFRPDDGVGNDRYIWAAERYFLNLDLEERLNSEARKNKNVLFISGSEFHIESSFSRYLNHVGGFFKPVATEIPPVPAEGRSTYKMTGAMLLLMQHGNISLRVFEQEKNDFLLLKVSESTTLLALQHMYRFLPALTILERICLDSQMDPRRQAKLFGSYLNRSKGEDDSTDYSELFSMFFNDIYERGRRLGDWKDKDLSELKDEDLTELDIPDFEHDVRTIKEWTGTAWSDSEKARIQNGNYIQEEHDIRMKYLEDVFSFFAES